MLAVAGFVLFKPEKQATAVQPPVAVAHDTATVAQQTVTQDVTTDRKHVPTVSGTASEMTAPQPIEQEQIHDEAKEKAAYLDKKIFPYFNELQSGLDRLKKLSNDPSLSGQQMLDAIRAHAAKGRST